MKVEFKELEEVSKKLRKVADENREFTKRFLLMVGVAVLTKAKFNSPVLTGELRKSYGMGRDNFQAGIANAEDIATISTDTSNIEEFQNELLLLLYNIAEYASFQEYDTRNRDGSMRTGFYMMAIAIDEVMQNMGKQYKEEFKQRMKEALSP